MRTLEVNKLFPLCHFVSTQRVCVCHHSNTEAWDQAGREVTFSLGQLEDKEPVLDYTLHREESQRQFEGEVFRGFSTEECDEEGEYWLKPATRPQ